MNEYRLPTDWERAAIRRLALDAPQDGITYANQADTCMVRPYDKDGDLEILVTDNVAKVKSDIEKDVYYLSELIYLDSDGNAASLILHGKQGVLGYVEWVKGEGEIVNRTPALENLRSAKGVPIADWTRMLRDCGQAR